MGDAMPAGVGPVLLRFVVWQAVEDQDDKALRVALAAALERGDAGVYELDDGYVGVKVMGWQLARVHRSPLVAAVGN